MFMPQLIPNVTLHSNVQGLGHILGLLHPHRAAHGRGGISLPHVSSEFYALRWTVLCDMLDYSVHYAGL